MWKGNVGRTELINKIKNVNMKGASELVSVMRIIEGK